MTGADRVVTDVGQVDAALDAVVAALGGARREGQHAMAREVATALEDGVPLLVEAGTGTGKSFAYLVPAVLGAVTRGERVVVSTATLALQRQILVKDLPLVADALEPLLPRPVEAAVLKGWHNYLCRQKIAGGYPEESGGGLFDLPAPVEHPAGDVDETLGDQVVRLRTWAEETSTGDRDDLVPGVTDRAWRQVSVTKMDCLGARCPMLAECFPERAKVAAHEADLVVTNHAMVGIAASGSPGVLPEHDALIVDEAHELVARSRAAATAELSVGALLRTASLVRRHGGVVLPELDEAIERLAVGLTGTSPGRLPDGLTPELAEIVTLLGAACREGLTATKPGPGQGSGPPDGGLVMARSALTIALEITDRLLSDSVANRRDVLWCEEYRDGTRRLRIAPLEVAGLLAENLFAERAAVLTSATLRIGGSFATTAGEVGLFGDDTYRALEVPAPFDYASQAIRYVAAHLPPPGRTPGEEMLAELTELVVASRGGVLGLFSSRHAAEVAAEWVRAASGLPVLCQGDDSLPALVAAFREGHEVSLFGTLSLWQGVDVPGATSRLVVIDRIPFPRPDDPVIQALGDVARSRGRNEFMSVSVPHAALLLAQGVGRLVRSTQDRGVVAVLDSRLATARYGSFLRASLPPMWPTTDPTVVRSALARLAVLPSRIEE
ncbi:ATP-dependent DNA helicase DinG [Salana multivorans]|uniref:ATP-dependent DNA helicase DinG n=1 Tax=Salana multivorans TaxID=120377 RepID=A0A3N2D268_9MICO|nr:ATP-dependent DNA helicase [Salana multivorans]ROR93863.1 ATP-dependent DNA helicase DinG [Salana multivorans]